MSDTVPQDIAALQVSADELRTTPRPIIVNVVATYDLTNPTINTEMLTMRLPGLGYHPQRFAAAKMRLPRAMTLTFCGGRAVCPGSRSVQGARQAALRFAEVQLRSGEYVQYRRFRLQNIVMSVWADFEVELRAIQEQYSARTDYCDSRFPGLSFRIGSGKRRIVCNIFVTGRVVITGSRDEEHSYKVLPCCFDGGDTDSHAGVVVVVHARAQALSPHRSARNVVVGRLSHGDAPSLEYAGV